MSLRNKLFGVSLALGLSLSFNTGVLAQQQQQQSPAQEGTATQRPLGREGKFGRHDGRGQRGMGGVMRMFSKLDLTDAQQQQVHSVMERYQTLLQPQREELRRLWSQSNEGTLAPEAQARAEQLQKEMRTSMQQMHTELLAILTTEQRAKLDQMKEEFKNKRREMRERRGDTPNDNQ